VRLQLVQDFLEAQLPVLRPRLYPRGVSSQDDAEPIPALSLGGIAAIELVRRWGPAGRASHTLSQNIVAVFDSRHDSLITYGSRMSLHCSGSAGRGQAQGDGKEEKPGDAWSQSQRHP
jgi:hypothetical protein